jgi:TIR domain-containing protein
VATKKSIVNVPVPIHICYQLLFHIGSNEFRWHNDAADDRRFILRWTIGKSWFSASWLTAERCRLIATMRPFVGDRDQTLIQFVAESKTLLDFEGFLSKAIDSISRRFLEHVTALLQAQTPPIFMSYMREDSSDVSGRIYDSLVAHFGPQAIFKDVDSIPPGVDFHQYIDSVMRSCRLLLAVIGNKWVSTVKSRLQNNSPDFVRTEIESALNYGVQIIPLLVGGTLMPAGDELPPSIKALAFRNAIPIRSDPDFHKDMKRLISGLETYFKN